MSYWAPSLVLVGGILISVLLAGCTALFGSRSRALIEVREVSRQLKEVNAELEFGIQERNVDLMAVNRTLRMLSDCNQVLVRTDSEEKLLEQVTSILTTIGGYPCCLVGFAERDARRSIRVVSYRGFPPGSLTGVPLTWNADDPGYGPLGTAIITREPVVVNDVLRQLVCPFWRAKAVELGMASLVTLPLSDGREIFGVLGILSGRTAAFHAAELDILKEMALDLGYGISALRSKVAHHRAEEELRNKESELREAQRLAHIGNWHWDAKTDITTGSDELLRIYGFDPATQTMPDFKNQRGRCYPVEEWERVNAAVQKTLETGIGYELEVCAFCGETPIWITTRSEVIRDSDGRIVSLRGTVQDITERKRAEEILRRHREDLENLVKERNRQLHESEERYRLVIEKTGQIVYEMDAGTGHTLHAGAIEEVVGYSSAEFQLPFEQWLAGIHPDDRERAMPVIQGALTRPGPFSFEYRYRRKDGAYRFLLDRGISFADATGKVNRVLGTMADVTTQHILEEGLRRKNRVFDASLAANSITDLAGAITEANDAFLTMWGFQTREEVIGRPIAFFFKEEADAARIQAVLDSTSRWQGEYLARRKDGSAFTAQSVTTTLTDDGGNVIGYQSSVMDVSAGKKMEIALKEAKEAADAASHAKSQFLANMSHEIRTPLNAILGFSQLLSDDPAITPAQRKSLRAINRAGDHLLALINDVLDLSKIEAGRMTVQVQAISLAGFAGDLETLFRCRCEAKGLRFEVSLGEPLPAGLLIDAGKMRQILVNLVGNAIKFTDTGKVTLSVEGERFRSDPGRWLLQFTVTDTGPGIPPEDRGKLFQTFQQTSIGNRLGGTGLGLAISRRFAHLLGGEIAYESEVGRGSSFRLEVPVQESDSELAEPALATRAVVGIKTPGESPRILVVDDREDNRTILTSFLTRAGFRVQEVGNGLEALEAFERWQPQAILMDMKMPEMSGFEATRRIRAARGGERVPIIAISASAYDRDNAEALAAGATAFLGKPFRAPELFDLLGRVLGLTYAYAPEAEFQLSFPALRAAGAAADVVRRLPPGLRREMMEAAAQAHFSCLMALIDQARLIDPATAAALSGPAERFDYPGLLKILRQEDHS